MTYSIEQCLANKGSILCPNNYIYHRTIEDVFLAVKIADSPNIYPITVFFQQLWQEYQLISHQQLPKLLNQSQEQQLWKTIVNETIIAKHQLLHEKSLIEQVQQTWHMCHQWQIPLSQPPVDSHLEYRQLIECFDAFKQYCDQNNWIDKTRLIDLLGQAIATLSLPKEIGLNGFISTTPQMQAFFNTLTSQGIEVNLIQTPQSQSQTHNHVFESQSQEINSMLDWADTRRLSGDKKIACIAPQLPFMVKAIQRSCLDLWGSLDKVQIAQTNTLLNYPMISIIFELSLFNQARIDVGLLCQIIQSPFLGDSITENTQRSLLCLQLHRLGQYEINKNHFQRLCQRYTPKLYLRLSALNEAPKPQSHQAWEEFLYSWLNILGWPGERSLSSEEYQLRDKFFNALDEFSRLDVIKSCVTFQQALDNLQQCCAIHHFQAQADHKAIHIITPIDAMGLQFDAVWVMTMDEDSWPPPANPNPFIPQSLAKTHPYPHCSNHWELAQCKAFTEVLLHTAPIIHFSHTGQSEGNTVAISPLLSTLAIEAISLPNETQPQPLLAFDDPGKAYPMNIENLPGGSAALKSQALCPFQAFARYRLKARPYPSLQLGLDPGERGSLVHQVLELFWQKVIDATQLAQYDEQQLQDSLEECITQSLKPLKSRFDKYFLILEGQRLSQLILPWLKLERTRPNFCVDSVEKEISISLAGHKIKTRLDRVDTLADGSQMIIDYKTGTVSLSQCFGERPEEPQLPLYCMASSNITAIAFAQVHPVTPKFLGVSCEDTEISGVKPLPIERLDTADNWVHQRQQWSDRLSALAEEFCHGQAAVNPKNNQQTCAQCDLQALCRVNDNHE